MDIKKNFGRNVQKFRQNLGWSQEELADRSNIHRTYISGVERGVRNPTLEMIAKIAASLNTTPKVLLDFEN